MVREMNKLHWKDVMYLVVMFMGVAVMWGMTQTKIEYLEKELDKKANSEVISTKLDYIIERVDNIEGILKK